MAVCECAPCEFIHEFNETAAKKGEIDASRSIKSNYQENAYLHNAHGHPGLYLTSHSREYTFPACLQRKTKKWCYTPALSKPTYRPKPKCPSVPYYACKESHPLIFLKKTCDIPDASDVNTKEYTKTKRRSEDRPKKSNIPKISRKSKKQSSNQKDDSQIDTDSENKNVHHTEEIPEKNIGNPSTITHISAAMGALALTTSSLLESTKSPTTPNTQNAVSSVLYDAGWIMTFIAGLLVFMSPV